MAGKTAAGARRGRGAKKRAAPLPAPDLAVLRPRMTADAARELVDRKKTDAFRTMIIRKPRPEAVRVESVDLYYEASVAASARYAADYYRKAVHGIHVERSVREVVVAGKRFAARGAGSLSKVIPGRGRNTVDIELDEHVYVDNSASVHLDARGGEIDAPYKGDLAKASEADPEAVLAAAGRGRVRRLDAAAPSGVCGQAPPGAVAGAHHGGGAIPERRLFHPAARGGLCSGVRGAAGRPAPQDGPDEDRRDPPIRALTPAPPAG